MKKAITITILFEADALNRDERVGNVLSIKKLTRGWGETYPFISKPAIRHYLWMTLNKSNPDIWKPAEVKMVKGNVIQFDIRKGNVIESPELDLFGYMSTIIGKKSVTRKAPLGITKAIALENWQGDMGFYSNHDLVSRLKEATPNPYNKEEAHSLFKLSFTLDLEKIGVEKFPIKKKEDAEPKDKEITVKFAEEDITISNIKEKEEGIVEGKIGKTKIELKQKENFIFIKASPEYETEEGLEIAKKTFSFTEKQKTSEEGKYWYKLDVDVNTELKKEEGKWIITLHRYTSIKKDKIKNPDNFYENSNFAKFELKDELKQDRIIDVLNAIYNGLYYHSSGECPGIVPLFLIAGIVKIPVPIFHSFVDAEFYKQNHRPKFKIKEETLRNAISNGWIETDTNKKLVFIEAREPETISKNFIEENSITTEWHNFLNTYLLEKPGKEE